VNAVALIDPKQAATWTARACLAGIVLAVTENDRGEPVVVVSRGALTKTLAPAAVDEWLARAGAPR